MQFARRLGSIAAEPPGKLQSDVKMLTCTTWLRDFTGCCDKMSYCLVNRDPDRWLLIYYRQHVTKYGMPYCRTLMVITRYRTTCLSFTNDTWFIQLCTAKSLLNTSIISIVEHYISALEFCQHQTGVILHPEYPNNIEIWAKTVLPVLDCEINLWWDGSFVSRFPIGIIASLRVTQGISNAPYCDKIAV